MRFDWTNSQIVWFDWHEMQSKLTWPLIPDQELYDFVPMRREATALKSFSRILLLMLNGICSEACASSPTQKICSGIL